MSSRTLPSSLNVLIIFKKNSFDCNFGRANKIRTNYPEIKKSLAVGSISEFISLIPTVEVKTRKLDEKSLLKHTQIFSKEFRITSKEERKMKSPVNIDNIRNNKNLAGMPSTFLNSSAQTSFNLNLHRLHSHNYSNKYSQDPNLQIKIAKKISRKTNTSTIFSTECQSTKHNSKKKFLK